MKSLLIIIFTLGFNLEPLLAFSEASWSSTINRSGRQRMLSQKMAKEYALILYGVQFSENTKNMENSIVLFEKNLAHLISESPNDRITRQFKKVQDLWGSYKADLLSKDASKMASVYKKSNKILKEMNRIVRMYETASLKAGIKGKGKVINIAGRQRMLSQKMSKECLFFALGFKPKKTLKDIKKSVELFDQSLSALINGDDKMRVPATTDASIKLQLQKVEGLWNEFKPLVDRVARGSTDKVLLQKIANQNSTLLSEMNIAVEMFE